MDFANDPRSPSPTDAIILPSIQELFPDHLLSSPLALRGRQRRGYSGPNPHPHHGHLSATSGVHMNSIQTGDGPSWAFNASREPTAHYATSTPSADTYRDSSRLPPRPLSAESIHPYGLHSSAQRIEPTPLTFYVHNDYLPRGSSAPNRSPSSQPTIHSQPSTQWQKSTSIGNSRLCTSSVTSTGCSSESSTQGSNTQSDWQFTRRYICPTCSKSFNRPSSLDVHCLIHSGLKPFQCTYPGCGRRFNVKSNMNRHVRTHMELEKATRDRARYQQSTPSTAHSVYASGGLTSASRGYYSDDGGDTV